jgi:hypothetical protein
MTKSQRAEFMRWAGLDGSSPSPPTTIAATPPDELVELVGQKGGHSPKVALVGVLAALMRTGRVRGTFMREEGWEHGCARSLVRIGMSEVRARDLVRRRWPLEVEAVLVELRARGLGLEVEDLTAFLRCKFERDDCGGGEPLAANSVIWPRSLVTELVEWCLANDRGRPGEDLPAPKSRLAIVSEVLAGLRSGDQAERMACGWAMSSALGRLDPTVGQHVFRLIGDAVAGRTPAVGELEARIKTHQLLRMDQKVEVIASFTVAVPERNC